MRSAWRHGHKARTLGVGRRVLTILYGVVRAGSALSAAGRPHARENKSASSLRRACVAARHWALRSSSCTGPTGAGRVLRHSACVRKPAGWGRRLTFAKVSRGSRCAVPSKCASRNMRTAAPRFRAAPDALYDCTAAARTSSSAKPTRRRQRERGTDSMDRLAPTDSLQRCSVDGACRLADARLCMQLRGGSGVAGWPLSGRRAGGCSSQAACAAPVSAEVAAAVNQLDEHADLAYRDRARLAAVSER